MAASSASEATMSTHEILPSLALSDIMHHFSPSPVDLSSNIIGHPNSPLLVSPVDVMTMRGRLKELQTAAMMGPDVTGLREAELFQIVSRLTETLPVEPAQLERQADTIGQLIRQRDLAVTQAEQERARWQAERESWERTAEALISQRTRISKSDEIERQRGLWETENRSLRDKLKEAESKLSAMETEVTRLRPLLLMQPYSISRLKQNLGVSSRDKGKKRDVEPPQHLRTVAGSEDPSGSKLPSKPDSHSNPSDYQSQNAFDSTLAAPPTIMITSPDSSLPSAPASKALPHSYVHLRRSHAKSHSKSSKHAKSASLTSDALTAHLLLAAQRIGRQRASLVTGLMRRAEQEKEEQAKVQEQLRLQAEQAEKDKMERIANSASRIGYYRAGAESLFKSPQPGLTTSQTLPSMPRTPKRNGYQSQTGQSGGSLASPSQFVFINASASTTPSGNPPPPEISRTPITITSHKSLPSTNPPTPLDSLLDAARSMMDSPGRRKAPEHPESPAPKRRRASGAAASRTGGKLTRVRSALEVLAEEAAAASGSGSKGANYDTLEEGRGNRAGLLDTHLSTKGKGRASGNSKDRERSISTATTATNSNPSIHVRQSSRRRGSFQHADDSASQEVSQPTRTSGRLSTKEILPVRKGRSRKSISQSTIQENNKTSLSSTSVLSASSIARVITPAEAYFPPVSGRGSNLQGRSTQASSVSGAAQIPSPSIVDGDSTLSAHGDGDVNVERRWDVREGDAAFQEAQDSRAYSTAETITNPSLLQGRKLQHLVNNIYHSRTDTTGVVEASVDTQATRQIPNHHLSVQPADFRVMGIGRGESDVVGVDADREELGDNVDVGSDVDVLADDVNKYDGEKTRDTTDMPLTRTSRSRSPILPKVLSPTVRNESGQLGADEDQDADAEGEMDLGDGEGQHPTPTTSS